jgi:hypothetical protein
MPCGLLFAPTALQSELLSSGLPDPTNVRRVSLSATPTAPCANSVGPAERERPTTAQSVTERWKNHSETIIAVLGRMPGTVLSTTFFRSTVMKIT